MNELKLETLRLIFNIFKLLETKTDTYFEYKQNETISILFWADRVNVIRYDNIGVGDFAALRYEALKKYLAGQRAKSQTEYNMNEGSVYAFLDQLYLWDLDLNELNLKLQEIMIGMV